MRRSSRQTILIVEDYRDTREMFKLLLEGLDYHVLLAEKAAEALVLVSQQEPDLILTDYNLPDFNGIEFIRRVRTLTKSNEAIPIIMITAYDLADVQTSAFDAGCTAFFKKPIKFDELASAVIKLLAESKERKGSVNNTSS
jgi:CheY-like chemotaxis protein